MKILSINIQRESTLKHLEYLFDFNFDKLEDMEDGYLLEMHFSDFRHKEKISEFFKNRFINILDYLEEEYEIHVYDSEEEATESWGIDYYKEYGLKETDFK